MTRNIQYWMIVVHVRFIHKMMAKNIQHWIIIGDTEVQIYPRADDKNSPRLDVSNLKFHLETDDKKHPVMEENFDMKLSLFG